MREVGERGLGEAIGRLTNSMTSDQWDLPFTEAIWWVVALRDSHGEIAKDEPLIHGVAWARNFAAHDLILPGENDLTYSGILGAGVLGRMRLGSGGLLVWVGVDSLPLSDWAKRHRGKVDKERPFYDGYVACQPLLDPLVKAQRFFVELP